jgi:hypothetical protein
MPEDSPNFLSPGGNYQNLLSYRRSGIIYDFTYRFCEKHLKRGDRSIEEMVQAARSGKQNIAEGGKASVTLPEMDLTLTNVTAPALKNCSSTTRTPRPRPPAVGQILTRGSQRPQAGQTAH